MDAFLRDSPLSLIYYDSDLHFRFSRAKSWHLRGAERIAFWLEGGGSFLQEVLRLLHEYSSRLHELLTSIHDFFEALHAPQKFLAPAHGTQKSLLVFPHKFKRLIASCSHGEQPKIVIVAFYQFYFTDKL